MRISDWSSDVCSSDLADVAVVDDFLQKLLEQHGSTPDVFPLAPWVSLVLKPLILASLSVSWPGFLNHASFGRRALLFRGLGRFAGAPEFAVAGGTPQIWLGIWSDSIVASVQ